MNRAAPTALIADDEPLLRETLERLLRDTWPALHVVAQARNGREAVELFDAHAPDVCFLDLHMPGMTGLDAARAIGRRAHLVFVTAYDNYAVQAFDRGALDYLVKPVDAGRLQETVTRLQERLRTAAAPLDTQALVKQLAARLKPSTAAPLRWIRASAGTTVRLVQQLDPDQFAQVHRSVVVRLRAISHERAPTTKPPTSI